MLVAAGVIELTAGRSLAAGDAARLTGTGPVELRTPSGAEVIAWEMRAGLSVG